MADSKPYTKRELDAQFDGMHESIHNLRNDITPILQQIQAQVLKTNGRVSKLEIWQGYVLGFCAAIGIVLFSLLIPVGLSYL